MPEELQLMVFRQLLSGMTVYNLILVSLIEHHPQESKDNEIKADYSQVQVQC